MKKTLPDGRLAEIMPLTWARARLVVSQPQFVDMFYDDGW